MTFVDFVERPFAFNSSINAIFASRRSAETVPLLRAIAKYLKSEFASYCFALFGRDWAIDERRFEKKELRQLPLPTAYQEITRAAEFADRLGEFGEQEIYREFSLSRSFHQAVEEFTSFRLEFQNGLIPEGVHRVPEQLQLESYIEVLEREMAAYIGGGRRFGAKFSQIMDRSLAVVFVDYLRDERDLQETAPSPDSVLREFDREGVNVFHDSAWSFYDPGSLRFSVIKPLSRVHWTVDRAIADAEMLISKPYHPSGRW